jgi:hypothetical protein
MITYQDIERQVRESLTGWEDDFDVAAITRDVIAAYELTGPAPPMRLADIDGDEYNEICARHDISAR